jgi:hypothetical protein
MLTQNENDSDDVKITQPHITNEGTKDTTQAKVQLNSKKDTWAGNVGKFDGSKRLPLVYVGSTPRIGTDSCSAVVDDLSTREYKSTE